MTEKQREALAKGRATATRNKLKKQVKEIQEQARFHRTAAQHHEEKAWEVEADLVKLAVDIFNEAKLEKVVADSLTACLGGWTCPPPKDEHGWLQEGRTPEEWKAYMDRVELNPLGVCVYDDPNDDYCLFCWLPRERK